MYKIVPIIYIISIIIILQILMFGDIHQHNNDLFLLRFNYRSVRTSISKLEVVSYTETQSLGSELWTKSVRDGGLTRLMS